MARRPPEPPPDVPERAEGSARPRGEEGSGAGAREEAQRDTRPRDGEGPGESAEALGAMDVAGSADPAAPRRPDGPAEALGAMDGAGGAPAGAPEPEGADEDRLRELIDRARQGDRGALDRLITYYRPRLRAWAASRLRGTPHDPSSMTQEVLTRMFRGLPGLQSDSPHALNAWLWTTLGHLIASAERLRTAQKRGGDGAALRGPLPDESPTPSRHLRERQGRRRLQQLISRLPADQGQALWRRHIEDWTVAEIAAAMSRTGPEVSSLLWRAREALRARVQDGEPVLPGEEDRLAPQIDRAMAEHAERVDRGEVLDGAARERFLASYPECAAVLRRLFEWEDRLAAWSREPG